MASRTLPLMVDRLMAAGMAGATPAAAVENASRANERALFGTFASLPAELAEVGFDGPALGLIGDVVGLSHLLEVAKPLAA